MKRDHLIRRIGRAAASRGVEWAPARQGGSHEVWRCGGTMVVLPRHREINELTAGAICRALELELGRDWWRR